MPPWLAPFEWALLDVHTRQLAAMRSGDAQAARVAASEHFRLLENMIAARRGVTWAALFGAGAPR